MARRALLALLLAIAGADAPPVLAGGTPDAYVGTVVLATAPSAVGALSERARDLLFRYLASDAAWRVTRIGAGATAPGTVAAIKRNHVAGELQSEDEIAAGLPPRPAWQWTRNGFVSVIGAGGDVRQTRLLIRLSPDGPPLDPPWMDGSVASRAAIDAARIPLRLFAGEGAGPPLESYLVLEGPGLGIEIFESDRDRQRAFTGAAVAEARGLLQAAQAQAESGGGELDRSRLTAGSIVVAGDPTMRIDAAGAPGRLSISGYVNPQRAGWVYLKVLDAASGVALQSPSEQRDTIEYVGWSDDPREQYYFNLPAQCRTPGRPDAGAARFELWFAAAAAADRRLLALEQPVACASD